MTAGYADCINLISQTNRTQRLIHILRWLLHAAESTGHRRLLAHVGLADVAAHFVVLLWNTLEPTEVRLHLVGHLDELTLGRHAAQVYVRVLGVVVFELGLLGHLFLKQCIVIPAWILEPCDEQTRIIVRQPTIFDKVLDIGVVIAHFSHLVNECLLHLSEVLVGFFAYRAIALD